MYINCFVTPLVYDYVEDTIKALHDKALGELIGTFKSIFEKARYNSLCMDNCIWARIDVDDRELKVKCSQGQGYKNKVTG